MFGSQLRVVAVLLLIMSAAACSRAEAKTQTVEIMIKHSKFTPSTFVFEAGERVRFILHNHDPIDHEFILGDGSVQDRHEKGSEAEHGAVPGEVSVPSGTTRSTSLTFTERGMVLIGCHAPGHYAYGMRGTVRVV